MAISIAHLSQITKDFNHLSRGRGRSGLQLEVTNSRLANKGPNAHQSRHGLRPVGCCILADTLNPLQDRPVTNPPLRAVSMALAGRREVFRS